MNHMVRKQRGTTRTTELPEDFVIFWRNMLQTQYWTLNQNGFKQARHLNQSKSPKPGKLQRGQACAAGFNAFQGKHPNNCGPSDGSVALAQKTMDI